MSGVSPLVGMQLVKYGVVGVCSNFFLYLFYIALTEFGVGFKTSMTVVYCCGVTGTFLFNRNWSFGDKGPWRRSFVRYVAVYALGYVVNLIGLVLLVEYLGVSHQISQAGMILLVAALLFVLQRQWIFSSSAAAPVGKSISGSSEP